MPLLLNSVIVLAWLCICAWRRSGISLEWWFQTREMSSVDRLCVLHWLPIQVQARSYYRRGARPIMCPPYGRQHKAMLRSVRPSVSLSVPFSDSLPFAKWRYARVAVSNAFDRGQHSCQRAYRLATAQYLFLTRCWGYRSRRLAVPFAYFPRVEICYEPETTVGVVSVFYLCFYLTCEHPLTRRTVALYQKGPHSRTEKADIIGRTHVVGSWNSKKNSYLATSRTVHPLPHCTNQARRRVERRQRATTKPRRHL